MEPGWQRSWWIYLAVMVGLVQLTGWRALLLPPLIVISHERFAEPGHCPWLGRAWQLPLAQAGVAPLQVVPQAPLPTMRSLPRFNQFFLISPKRLRVMVKVQKLSLKSQLTMLAMLNKQRPWPNRLLTRRLLRQPCMAQTQTGVALQWPSANAVNTQILTRKKLSSGSEHKRCTQLELMNQVLLNSVSTCVATMSLFMSHFRPVQLQPPCGAVT